jgi:hypothetical protein
MIMEELIMPKKISEHERMFQEALKRTYGNFNDEGV